MKTPIAPDKLNLYITFMLFLNSNEGQMRGDDSRYYDFLDDNRISHEALMQIINLCKANYECKYFVLHHGKRDSGIDWGHFYLTTGVGDIVQSLPRKNFPKLLKLPKVVHTSGPIKEEILMPQPDPKEWTKAQVVKLLTNEIHIVGRMLGAGYDKLESIHSEWAHNWLINPNNLMIMVHQAHRDSYKCFGVGTRVLMADGTSKNIEDIKVGDKVMGWDSTPRLVLETHSGTDKLYKVTLNKTGESYICNSNHVLTLRQREIKHNKFHCVDDYRVPSNPNIIDIPVEDFINSPASRTNGNNSAETFFKHFKQGVNFVSQKVNIPPYILGCWIGDGHSKRVAITTMDEEIRQEFKKWAEGFELMEHIYVKTNVPNEAKTYAYYSGQKYNNGALKLLQQYNLINNKHIPHCYLKNSRVKRLELLAGLIDTDGHYSKAGHYTYTTILKELAYQVEWLARSLGFHATASQIETICNGKKGMAWQVYINGKNICDIPVRLVRKKASPKKYQDDRHLSFSQTITKAGTGKYYGIMIEGDGKFLLDNFLVVHNSTTLRLAIAALMILQPLTTILLIRKSEDAVKELINGVSKILDTPLFTKFVYILHPDIVKKGGFKKTTDTALAIDTNLNISLSGEFQLRGMGLGSPMTGKHSKIIITDDICTLDDRESTAERQRTIARYQELMNVLSNEGKNVRPWDRVFVLNIGTPWQEEDVFKHMDLGLKEKTQEQLDIEAKASGDRTPEERERLRQLDMQRGKFVYNCYQTGLMSDRDIEWKKKVLNDETLFAANYLLSLVSDDRLIFPKIDNVGHYSKSFFHQAYEVYALVDAKYSGKHDTCSLTICCFDWEKYNLVTYGKIYKVPLDLNYRELADEMFMCGVTKMYMEKNTDKGLMGAKFRELGLDCDCYHESQNKYVKMVSTLRPYWRETGSEGLPSVQFVQETDPEYLAQINNYRKGVTLDDAPDGLASLILRGNFSTVPARIL